MLAFFRFSANAASGGEPQRITAELVSGRYFELLGVGAAVGRTIGPEDDAAPGGLPVAVLSYAYWQRAFAGDRAAIGQTVVVNGQRVTIIGVSAGSFTGLELDFQPDVRLPMAMAPRVAPFPWIGLEQDQIRWVQVFARLAPGVSPRQADAALQPFYAGWIDRALAGPFAGTSETERAVFRRSALTLQPGSAGTSYLRRDWSTPLLAMSALAGLLLLLTAVNVAGLFIGRGVERRGELALRLSLGASRGRVVRELVLESLLLIAVGGAIGVWLAPLAADAVVPFLPIADGVPNVSAALSGRVLVVALAFLGVVALVAGLLPAWLTTRVDSGRTHWPDIDAGAAARPLSPAPGRGRRSRCRCCSSSPAACSSARSGSSRRSVPASRPTRSSPSASIRRSAAIRGRASRICTRG